MMTNKAYATLLKQVERLQEDLMMIEDYDEDTYKAFENLINNLEEMTEEN